MKNKLMMIALASAGFALPMSAVYASAGTVNFTGEIINAACTVDVSSQNQTVGLGTYDKGEFTNTGDVTSAKKFSIVLKNCPNTVPTAHVIFDGTPDTSDSTLLAIDSTVPGAAQGVAINLMTSDKDQLPVQGENSYRYTLSSAQDNTLDFYAQYKATSVPVEPGPANSVANFSISYN